MGRGVNGTAQDLAGGGVCEAVLSGYEVFSSNSSNSSSISNGHHHNDTYSSNSDNDNDDGIRILIVIMIAIFMGNVFSAENILHTRNHKRLFIIIVFENATESPFDSSSKHPLRK